MTSLKPGNLVQLIRPNNGPGPLAEKYPASCSVAYLENNTWCCSHGRCVQYAQGDLALIIITPIWYAERYVAIGFLEDQYVIVNQNDIIEKTVETDGLLDQ